MRGEIRFGPLSRRSPKADDREGFWFHRDQLNAHDSADKSTGACAYRRHEVNRRLLFGGHIT